MNKIFERAEWILADCKDTKICDRYFEYRTSFMAKEGVETKLYISANSQYAVYFNGCFVDCGQYDDYEDYQVYDTLDVTRFVKQGNNELYIGHYVCGNDFSTRRKQVPGLIFDVWSKDDNLLSSDCNCPSRENLHFLNNQECITVQLGYNFEYDATAKEAEYAPSILAGKEKNLFARPIKKLTIDSFAPAEVTAQGAFLENSASLSKAMRMQTAYLSALKIDSILQEEKAMCPTDGSGQPFLTDGSNVSWNLPKEMKADGAYLIFDLKKESAGLLEFSLEVPEQTEVLIGFGEHLDDLRVRSAVGGRNFCFRYLAKKGMNTFFYPYQRMGLRYLQFHIYSSEGKVSAGIRAVQYPLTKYTLPLVDKLHRRICEVGSNTLALCMHEHYEDCPWREQALYAMDSRIQMLCGYYAFGEYEFPKANLKLMLHSYRPDGLLELCAPGKVPVDIPSFSAVFVRQVLEYVQYSKDTSFAKEIFIDLKKMVDGFADRILDNHLVPLYYGEQYWNFYEWRDGIDGGFKVDREGIVDCLLNAFTSDAFRCFAKICEIADHPELSERYLAYHKAMNEAMHQMFYDEKTGGYRSNLEDVAPRHALTQGMMLFVDAVPESCVDGVLQMIAEGNVIPCSISMSIYVYEALLKYPGKYRAYVLSEIERIWGKMLSVGADTFWETDMGADDFDKAGSLCHGWSAVPIYLFGKYNLEDVS